MAKQEKSRSDCAELEEMHICHFGPMTQPNLLKTKTFDPPTQPVGQPMHGQLCPVRIYVTVRVRLSVSTGECLFLCIGIYLCYCIRSAPSFYFETKFISFAIFNELLISAVYYVVR